MKLNYVILAAVATGICDSGTVAASHLSKFHGLRTAASVVEQKKKKKLASVDSCDSGDRLHDMLRHRTQSLISDIGEEGGYRQGGENGRDRSSGVSYGLRAYTSLARENSSTAPQTLPRILKNKRKKKNHKKKNPLPWSDSAEGAEVRVVNKRKKKKAKLFKSEKPNHDKKKKELTICHVDPDDPSIFDDIVITKKEKHSHMKNNPLDRPGPCKDYCQALCDDGNMCTINHEVLDDECTCLAQPQEVNCDDGDPDTEDTCDSIIGCVSASTFQSSDSSTSNDDKKKKELTICHVDPDDPSIFDDIVITKKEKHSHMKNNPLDRPGPCKDYCQALCDDGNMCTINHEVLDDECICLAQPQEVNCDDGDPDTEDTCDPIIGCVSASTFQSSDSSTSNDDKSTDTTTSIDIDPLAIVLDLIEQFDNPDNALNAINLEAHEELDAVVSAVGLLVDDDMKDLVTSKAVVTSFFDDPLYHADLFPARRLSGFFDWYPQGCGDSTALAMAKILEAIFVFLGVVGPVELSSSVTQDLIIEESKLINQIFMVSASSWFASQLDALNACINVWEQLRNFHGLKSIYAAMTKYSPININSTVLLAMIAMSVTNGATLASDMTTLTDEIDDLIMAGNEWQNTCFVTTCDGDPPICDDGDLCTVDRNQCDFTTDWAWECTHTTKFCSPGYSCDLSDGNCKPNDALVPCVAVIDEDGSFGTPNQVDMWDQFRTRFPARPFCLLIVEQGSFGTMDPPSNFQSDGLTIYSRDVKRNVEEDWVAMCGLDSYTSSNVKWVGLFIDNSGSMEEDEVAASRDLFYDQLEQKGIEVKKVVNEDENWILPFLKTLVPEEEANSVHLDQYVFWPSYDSVGYNITQHESLSPAALAGICNSNVNCLGFNSDGWIKSFIKPLDQWIELEDSNEDEGLYIKKPDTYVINDISHNRQLSTDPVFFKRPLSDNEVKGLRFITTWTIPYNPLPRYDAILEIAPGTLWALHQGVLDLRLWNKYPNYYVCGEGEGRWDKCVDNAFLHNVCGEEYLDPMEVCQDNEWHVGIAYLNPNDPNPTLSELEASATYYYQDEEGEDPVKLALTRTIAGAYDLDLKEDESKVKEKYEKIDGNDKLKKSWLLRNHFIGLRYKSEHVTKHCETDPNPLPACSVLGNVKILLQSMVRGDLRAAEGYVFWPSYNSEPDTIGLQLPLSKFSEAENKCNINPDCKGFNTKYELKSAIKPLDEWVKLGGEHAGLYIKNPRITGGEYIINNKNRNANEKKWINWIVDYTIPNIRDLHYAVIPRVAWGVLWSLKHGVLMRPTDVWDDPAGPFRYSVCGETNVEPTDATYTCSKSNWRVGIAAAEPSKHHLPDLKADAEKYYGSVEYALSQSVKQADFSVPSSAYSEILADNGILKASWLLRNHLIGLTNQGDITEAACKSNPEPWCNHFDDVTVLLQSLIGGECKPIYFSDYEFYPGKDSFYDDILPKPLSGASVLELRQKCNSNGELINIDIGASPCQGLYKKKVHSSKVQSSVDTVLTIAREEMDRPVYEPSEDTDDEEGHIEKYRKAAYGYTMNGDWIKPTRGHESWCADFVSWVFQEAGYTLGEGASGTNPETGEVSQGFFHAKPMQVWFDNENIWHKNEKGFVPMPGDIFIRESYKHVGIVESVVLDGSTVKKVTTIEGNTSHPKSAYDGVARKTYPTNKYPLSTILGYGRMKFTKSHASSSSSTNKGTLYLMEGSIPLKTECSRNSVFFHYVHWPSTGGNSGPTICYGYDIGTKGKKGDKVVIEEEKQKLMRAGMPEHQAEILSSAVGEIGMDAKKWLQDHKDEVGFIDEDVIDQHYKNTFAGYIGAAKERATNINAEYQTSPRMCPENPAWDSKGINAVAQEEEDKVPGGTYRMTDDQWGDLHPAMKDFLGTLKYAGSYYQYEQVARINELLLKYHGQHLNQFKAVATLFGYPETKSYNDKYCYMDWYAIDCLKETAYQGENYYDINFQDIKGSLPRANRIRLSFLVRVIKALKAGYSVEMRKGGDRWNCSPSPCPN